MESSDSNPHSLIEMLRKKIVDAISSTVAPNKWRVVVVDRPSLKIVSFVLKMHEILEQNVMAVQLITRSRQQYPDVEAVYILVPSEDSVSRVIEDFQPILEQSGAGHTRYARAHLFFTGALSDSLLSSLRQSPAGPYIKRVEELYIEYNPVAIESRVFLTIPSEHPFYALYSPHSSDMFYRDLNATADRVLSVIACLGIEPYIRYYCPAQSLAAGNVEYPKIAKEMAEKLQQKLNCYYAHNLNKSTNPHEAPTHSPPSTVIILDRSVDMYAPLLHEFTYQAVVHDLIDLEDGNKYAYEISTLAGETRQASATLSEQTDMLWRQHRHKHLGRVAEELATQFGSMVSKNTGVKAAHTQDRNLTLGELRVAISELPEFNQLQAMYSLHIDLASKCLDIINEQELTAVSEFEQELVTGVSSNGEPVTRTSLEIRLITLLDNQTIEKYDRIRLLFLYLVMVNGSNELDRRRLEQVPQCLTINDRRAAVNLQQFGIPTKNQNSSEENHPDIPVDKCGKYEWNTVLQTNKDVMCTRFAPAVYSIIRESLAGELCTTLFPWIGKAPPEGPPKHVLNVSATSLRRRKGEWGGDSDQKKAPKTKEGGVLVIYIAGGVTLSEMRTVYEIARTFNRQVYIGSTHIITPRGFVDDLKSLHLKMLM